MTTYSLALKCRDCDTKAIVKTGWSLDGSLELPALYSTFAYAGWRHIKEPRNDTPNYWLCSPCAKALEAADGI
jgi:hypothetical protein